jgi:uncharacterized protein (TIGR00297 family)
MPQLIPDLFGILAEPQALAFGALLALLVALGGSAAGALTRSGALGAFVVGTCVFGLGGPIWGLLLVAFFVSSSALSEWQAEDKAVLASRFEKSSRRDIEQVLANGGLPAALAVAQGLGEAGILPSVNWLPAFVGALAAVTADTWATEVGLMAEMDPRLITTGEPVPRGTSGGVTIIGTLAATAGGIFIGLCAVLLVALAGMLSYGVFDLALLDWSGARFALLAPVAGLSSAAFDSYLGAMFQARYLDPKSGEGTERATDAKGQPHALVHGHAWMNNDLVNFLASLLGALLALGLDRAVFG